MDSLLCCRGKEILGIPDLLVIANGVCARAGNFASFGGDFIADFKMGEVKSKVAKTVANSGTGVTQRAVLPCRNSRKTSEEITNVLKVRPEDFPKKERLEKDT